MLSSISKVWFRNVCGYVGLSWYIGVKCHGMSTRFRVFCSVCGLRERATPGGGMSNWHLDERLQNCRFFCSFLSWWPNEHKTIRCKIRLEVVFIFSQHFSALEIILKHSFWYRVNKAQTHCATTPVSSSSTRHHHHHSFSPSKEHRASTGALQRTRLFVNVLVLSQE